MISDLEILINILIDAPPMPRYPFPRQLDEMIATAVYGEPSKSGDFGGPYTMWWFANTPISEAPHFVTSLDASIPNERITDTHMLADNLWEARALDSFGKYYMAVAASEPLARRAVALRSLAADRKRNV